MKSALLIIALLFNVNLFAQEGKVMNSEAVAFQITSKKDTIDFLVIDSVLTQQKPILLFCQGSLPIPLFFEYGEGQVWMYGGGVRNFNIEELRSKYHVVVISMPKTPLTVHMSKLNKQYSYISDTTDQNSFHEDYLLADKLETYVCRANKVLKFVLKQDWAKKDLTVIGHSQGSKVALELTVSRKDVQRLGLFAFNPNGRLDQKIRQIKEDAESGKLPWDYVQSKTEAYYQFARDFNNEDSIAVHPEYTAWKSFSHSQFKALRKVECPIYIAYGTNDISADWCDLLPLFFIENEIEDYKIVRYPEMDHNFFSADPNKSQEENTNWPMVMSEFYKWSITNASSN